MPSTINATRPRLQAAITGKGKEMDSQEAHARNVKAITRRIHTLTMDIAAEHKKIRAAKERIRVNRKEKRTRERELRAVLQRDSSMGIESEDHPVMIAGGKADATDR